MQHLVRFMVHICTFLNMPLNAYRRAGADFCNAGIRVQRNAELDNWSDPGRRCRASDRRAKAVSRCNWRGVIGGQTWLLRDEALA